MEGDDKHSPIVAQDMRPESMDMNESIKHLLRGFRLIEYLGMYNTSKQMRLKTHAISNVNIHLFLKPGRIYPPAIPLSNWSCGAPIPSIPVIIITIAVCMLFKPSSAGREQGSAIKIVV